jgi:hypothetical protein
MNIPSPTAENRLFILILSRLCTHSEWRLRSFDLVAFSVEDVVAPAKLSRHDHLLLCISPVRVDDKQESRAPNAGLVLSGIQAGAQCPGRSRTVNTDGSGKSDAVAKDFRQEDHFRGVDRLDRDRPENAPVMVCDQQLFFAFLVFVARIVDA